MAVYGYDNLELVGIFKEYGFVKQIGTFSDCSNLAAATKDNPRACVNLSVGYQHEHSVNEILDIELMEDTLEVMCAVEIPEVVYDYVYTPRVIYGWGVGYSSRNLWEDDVEYAEEAWYTEIGVEEGDDDFDDDMAIAVVCEFCSEHAPLYDFQGSSICKTCLKQIRY